MTDREALKRAYGAFCAGARLRSDDVRRLFGLAGIEISNNRLRELGRDTDRGLSITAQELHALIGAWADEIRGPRP